MSAHAAWAGVIVSDVGASAPWYVRKLGAAIAERDDGWAKLSFPNGTVLELFTGDRADPGATFPSYGVDAGPPVLPGYAVEDAAETAERAGLDVMRSLPGWVVVAAPDRLRVVLLEAEPQGGAGLVGFRFTSTDPHAQERFLDGIGVDGPELADGEVAVVPVVRCGREGDVVDPDGTRIARAR